MVGKQRFFFPPELRKDLSHTTEAPTATQLLSFLSFLEVVERTGYKWWTDGLIRITYHYSPVVMGAHDQSFFQFLTIPYKVEFRP